MAMVGFYISLLLFSMLFLLPETPYFLLKSGQKEKSFEVLKWLRPTEDEAQKEFQELSLSESKKGENDPTLSEMLKPPYRWPFLVAVFLHFFQQGTGISPISSFTGIIFEKTGCNVDPGLTGVLSAVCNIVVLVFVVQSMGKYPRKKFIDLSSIVMMTSLLSLAFHIYIRDHEGPLQNLSLALSYFPFLCFLGFMMGFGIGWAPIPWMFIGDSLPLQIRSSGAGIVIATNWALNFVFTKTFNWAILLLGHHNVYILYAAFTLLGMIVMNRQIPETFGFSDAKLLEFYEDGYKKKKL
ncbi:Cubilin [Armadillidium vulgare]|nr:Cubilin [Armadillidium vulgare]